MTIVRTVALYILVLFTTFYAGIGVFNFICPFDQHYDTVTFAKYWQIVDGYMGKRMSIFMPIWLLVIFTNLIIFFKTWRQSPIFWIILTCLVLLIIDISFTLKEQIPINNYFQQIDVDHLTAQQIQIIQGFREQTDENFAVRGIRVLIVFFLMSITPYLLPQLNRFQTKT